MGWDISIYAEIRRPEGWRLAVPVERNRWFAPGNPTAEPKWKPVEIYKERNSPLFAILAGIGSLAGEEGPFPCLSGPRGVPDDLSPELATWYAQNDGRTFAASWLLLEELLQFDWHSTRGLRRGVVDPKVAPAFRSASGGEPDSAWPSDIPYGYSDQVVLGDGVEVRWWESCAEAVGAAFFSEVLEKLQTYGRPRDVRVVFWFDF